MKIKMVHERDCRAVIEQHAYQEFYVATFFFKYLVLKCIIITIFVSSQKSTRLYLKTYTGRRLKLGLYKYLH